MLARYIHLFYYMSYQLKKYNNKKIIWFSYFKVAVTIKTKGNLIG